MAISTLHSEIKKLAGARPAFIISREMLRALALNSIEKSLQFFGSDPPGTDQVFIKTGNPSVCGRFRSLSVKIEDFDVQLVAGEESPVDLHVMPSFILDVELFEPNSGLAYSTVSIEAPPAKYPIEAAKNRLSFFPPVVKPDVQVINDTNRQAAIAASGIDEQELLRVEGAMAYGTGARVLQSVLGEIAPIDLDAVFPAFRFGGKFETLRVGDDLVLIPETFTFIGNTGCPQGDALQGAEILLPEKLGGRGGTAGEILVPPAKPHRRPMLGDGLLMTYLPKPVLQVQFEKIAPSAAYREHDHGFIGHELSVNTLIRSAELAIDVSEQALMLRLGLYVDGAAKVTIDVPCVGRVTIARVDFNVPERDKVAMVETWIRFAVDTRGRLLVLTELKPLSLGEAEVDVEIFSRYASYMGGTAKIMAYVADYLIKRVLAVLIPSLLADELKKNLNQHFFVILDMERQLKYFLRQPNWNTWSGDDESVLLGLNWNG